MDGGILDKKKEGDMDVEGRGRVFSGWMGWSGMRGFDGV